MERKGAGSFSFDSHVNYLTLRGYTLNKIKTYNLVFHNECI